MDSQKLDEALSEGPLEFWKLHHAIGDEESELTPLPLRNRLHSAFEGAETPAIRAVLLYFIVFSEWQESSNLSFANSCPCRNPSTSDSLH